MTQPPPASGPPADPRGGLTAEVQDLRALVLALADTVGALADELEDPKGTQSRRSPQARADAREEARRRRPPVEAAAARHAARLARLSGAPAPDTAGAVTDDGTTADATHRTAGADDGIPPGADGHGRRPPRPA